MKRFAIYLLWIVSLSSPSPVAASQADYYVATNGSDKWTGKLAAPNEAKTDGPFATLERARDALRAPGKTGGTVLIRGGTYRLKRTFGLGPKDSGSKDRPTVFAAYPGEQPVLSGGVKIQGTWQKADGSGPWTAGQVFSIKLPKGTVVEDLFVDGKRQPRARMPNTGFFKARDARKSKTVFGFEKGQLAAWPDADGGVVIIKPYEWVDFHLPIAAIDEQAQTVTLKKACGYPLVPGGYGAPSEYHIENVRAALDRPGEWCFDRKTGMLHFWPPAGTDLSKAEITAGNLHVMVALDGDAKRNKWVEHVVLRGLAFRFSGREGKWRHYEGTAVRLSHGVRHCVVRDCRFLDLGACGVVIWKECQNNTVAENEFTRTGDTCIKVFDYLGEGPPMSSGNQILNNHIHHGGTVRKSISGIGIEMSEKSRVVNNLIHDMPYNGIRLSGTRFVGWGRKNARSLRPPYTAAKIKPYVRSRGNVVENNHIHHVMQELFDGGGIYFWGTMGKEPNTIRNNLIHHVGTGKRTAVGIYLDDSCDDVHVYDNVVYGVNIGMHLHGAPRNLVENNVFAYCGSADISIQPEVYNIRPMNTIFRRNILAWGRDKLFSTGEGWNKNWGKQPIGEMDYNLYWRGGQPVSFRTGHLNGVDKHSVVADPGFARPKGANDHVLRPGSAAQKQGIKPIDLNKVGLQSPLTWETDLPKHKPVAFPLTAEELSTLPGWRSRRSTAHTLRTSIPITVDGRLDPKEWPGWTPPTGITIEEHYDKVGRSELPSFAYILFDDENLYVALRNQVKSGSSLRRNGGAWGKDDGAEVCLRTPGAPILVLRGYPSGKFESSAEAGAPAARAEALGKAVTFVAEVRQNEWTAEYRIPLEAAGIDLTTADSLDFNIGVFKKETREWIAWVGTGKENWQVKDAGKLVWRPAVAADAKELLSGGDVESGKDRVLHWHPLWWNTSNEKEAKDRDPKCDWVPEGVAGSRCFKIHSDARERMRTRQGGFHQEIDSSGPGAYLLTYDLRAENLALSGASEGGSFSSYVHVVKTNGRHGANLGQGESTVRQGTFNWTRFEVPIDVPADAKTLTVIFQFQRVVGAVWIDNVSFKRCRPGSISRPQ